MRSQSSQPLLPSPCDRENGQEWIGVTSKASARETVQGRGSSRAEIGFVANSNSVFYSFGLNRSKTTCILRCV